MKAFILFFSVLIIDLSKPLIFEFQGQKVNRIEINDDNLYLNFVKVNAQPALSELIQLIGQPSRSKIQSETEIKIAQEKFGTLPSNIYTYDDDGILLYQKPDGNIINSITIDFIKQKYDFSPQKTYNQVLLFNTFQIDRNTSLFELKKIPGIIVDEGIYFTNSALLGKYRLSFEFTEAIYKNQLASMSINLIKPIEEKRNEMGWSNEEVQIMKASVKNIKELKEIAKQYNFTMDKFAECYALKISTQITFKEIQNPDERVNAIVGKSIEECVIQLIGN
jgi:hypothetical protein